MGHNVHLLKKKIELPEGIPEMSLLSLTHPVSNRNRQVECVILELKKKSRGKGFQAFHFISKPVWIHMGLTSSTSPLQCQWSSESPPGWFLTLLLWSLWATAGIWRSEDNFMEWVISHLSVWSGICPRLSGLCLSASACWTIICLALSPHCP